MSTEEPNAPSVVTERIGSVGLVTLNRPRAINALTHEMTRTIQDRLDAWQADPAIAVVVIAGAGERGFCAGGDVKFMREGASGEPGPVIEWWRDEYRLDHTVATYPTPVVTLLHGITMGGGMGLGCHAAHRLVTPDARLAMPEVRIGLAPDVGGTLLLARMPGRLGEHFALTCAEARGGDAVHLGLADALVEPIEPAELARRLDDAGLDATLCALARPLPPSGWTAHRPWIDEAYAAADVPEIMQRLSTRGEDAAREAGAAIATMAPLGCAVALEAVRRSRDADDLAATLAQDLRVMSRLLEGTDPDEGIRARVVDRDHEPRWDPPSHNDVPRDRVEAHFTPIRNEIVL